jgi:hypothetical protein
MLERNLNYQYNRTVHEFYTVSADVLAIRVIGASENILEIGKGAFSVSDLEDSSFIELFVDGRIIRMDYSGTLPAVRTADIALIRPYLPCGGSGGGGGGNVVVSNTPLPVTVGNFPTGWATETKQDSQIVQETAIATAIGTQTDPTVINPATNASVISYLRGILTQLASGLTNWTSLFNRLPVSLTGSGNFKVAIVESTATITTNTKVRGTITKVKGVATTTPAVNIIPPNSNRNYLTIQNLSNGIDLYYTVDGVAPTSGDNIIGPKQMRIWECNFIETGGISLRSASGSVNYVIEHA